VPEKIVIYETFNPGAVVRIWSFTIAKTWELLWENDRFYTQPIIVGNKARLFSPPLRKTYLSTRLTKSKRLQR